MIDIRLKKELQGAHGKMTLEVDSQIHPGDLTVIYGVSGAGKTSPWPGWLQLNLKRYMIYFVLGLGPRTISNVPV